ncbi:MAG: opacity protein-like surface antigen [Paracoccaceae bacterium]|jgi:opacity protein-like surface antigen
MKFNGAIKAGIAVFASLAISTAISTGTSAQRASSDHSGDYLSFLLIGGVSKVDEVTSSAGTLQLRNDADEVAGIGLTIGYNWAKKGLPLRTEIEYHYRARFDFDTRVTGSAGYENQLSTHALIVNSYYDYQMNDRWALFAGGGIGWAQNVSDVARVPIGGGTKTELITRTDNFTWNAALGVIWSFAENWDAEFRYRYIDLGKVESGPHIDGTTIEAESYTSHDLILGITYRF